VRRPVEDAEVHQPDISAPMPEPKCSAEASEESDEVVADDAKTSPAVAQGSSSVDPLAGELVGDPADVVAITAPQFGPKRMREAGMSPEAIIRVCSERAKKRAGPRHTILPLPPHYPMRGERAVHVRGRKRTFTALNEPHASSTPGSESSSSDSSRPPRPRRPTYVELEDGGVRAIYTRRGGPAVPTTGGD
jgi:hypothetical protein